MILHLVKSIGRIFSSFLTHWYGGGFRTMIFALGNSLRAADQKILIRESALGLFSFRREAGVLGNGGIFLGKSAKLISAALFYSFISFLFIAFYLFWAAIPPYLIYKTIHPR